MSTVHKQKGRTHPLLNLRREFAGVIALSTALAFSPMKSNAQASAVKKDNISSSLNLRVRPDAEQHDAKPSIMKIGKGLKFIETLEKPYDYTVSSGMLKPKLENRWSKLDQGLMISTIVLDAIDWNQTLHRADHLYKFDKNSGYTYYYDGNYFGNLVPKYEGGLPIVGNPILGNAPSPMRVNLYFIGLTAADIIIPKLLRNHDKLRKAYYSIRIGAELDCTIRNIRGDASWNKWYSSSEAWLRDTCKEHPDLKFCH